jgi:hypothetical protein
MSARVPTDESSRLAAGIARRGAFGVSLPGQSGVWACLYEYLTCVQRPQYWTSIQNVLGHPRLGLPEAAPQLHSTFTVSSFPSQEISSRESTSVCRLPAHRQPSTEGRDINSMGGCLGTPQPRMGQQAYGQQGYGQQGYGYQQPGGYPGGYPNQFQPNQGAQRRPACFMPRFRRKCDPGKDGAHAYLARGRNAGGYPPQAGGIAQAGRPGMGAGTGALLGGGAGLLGGMALGDMMNHGCSVPSSCLHKSRNCCAASLAGAFLAFPSCFPAMQTGDCPA